MFQRTGLGDQQLPAGVVVASYETYEQAQAAIAKVSGTDTELAGLAIVGNDLKLVERIVGRLTWGKVAMRGAIRGLGFGAFLGLMFLVFIPEAISSVLVFPLLGLAFGILLAVVQHSLVRRKRDFASTQQVLAARYDVVAPRERAGRAMQVIGQRDQVPAAAQAAPAAEQSTVQQPTVQQPTSQQQPTEEQLRAAAPPQGEPAQPQAEPGQDDEAQRAAQPPRHDPPAS